MKPSSDLCFECQQNATKVLQRANLTEGKKADRLKAAELHLEAARNQRLHYNEQCKAAKAEGKHSNPLNLHVHLGEYNALQF